MADNKPAWTTATAATTTTTTTTAAAPPPPPTPTLTTPTSGAHGRRASPAVPVGLHEAALDSPTFRAAAVHFAEQMDAIERWLDGYTQSTSRLVHDMLRLEDTINNYVAKLAPPLPAAESVLDPDYTLVALRRAAEGAREWWQQTLHAVRRLDAVAAEPVRAFAASDLRAFRESRRALEVGQKTFDATLARSVGQTKTKEPSALREDAFAVYETRKAYLKASLDFCQLAPQLRFALDKLLVRACADMHRELRRSREPAAAAAAVSSSSALFGDKWADEMERIRGWSREMETSEAVFRRELQMARRDIGESTLTLYRPSRELEDYSVSTVPYLGSRGPADARRKADADNRAEAQASSGAVSQKQGWLFLFLRTTVGKNVRTNWVRRWYYCRDGVFGWLVQGLQGVLQGDEIGVLLCSVKPAVQEERRFCFEVKTKTTTLLLQAETQTQLIEWLASFELAKKKALEDSMGRDNSASTVDPAFSVISSPIPEFSAKQLDGLGSIDEQMAVAERGGGGGGGTLPMPGQDPNASPASFDVTTNVGPPRRAITALGREEGEGGGRDTAARIKQKLDLHRRVNTGGGADGGGIASLISASHNLLPAYTGYPSPNPPATSSPRPPPTALLMPALMLPANHGPGSLAPATLAKPPVTTALSRAAVAAAAERASSAEASHRGMPSGLLANVWGSGPWASTYSSRAEAPTTPRPDADEPFIATVQAAPAATTTTTTTTTTAAEKPADAPHVVKARGKTAGAGAGADGPAVEKQPVAESFTPKYPAELRVQHALFRLLFPSVPLEEKLVLVFNGAWTSASGDRRDSPQGMAGNGRVFVTPDNMYFYGHQMGLVVAYAISLDIITEVTAAPGKDCDFIFLHLGQDLNDTGFTRITLKMFLGDLPLLHSRLNLLVDDLQSEEPMDLDEIVHALMALDSDDYAKKSPSVESWEEVSSNTPMDDKAVPGRRRPVVAPSLFPGGGRDPAPGTLRKPMPKFQLPANPVVYEPADMGAAVAERHFEISAKACFHVLFGDKSFVFPRLYFERRAKEIAQGPWALADHGTMRREFRFKVDYAADMLMLGRKRPGEVTDRQTIGVFEDHVMYVVTHVQTAWHLPHSQAFTLVTKVVITHLAKSKCKLALFTKVDWANKTKTVPAFAKNMIQRQALGDAANNAEELAEVATDQVRKLGPHSRTKRAIQVYGDIGKQTNVVVFTPAPGSTSLEGAAAGHHQIRPRTLTDMLMETARSFFESVITSLVMGAFAGLRKLFSVATAHRVILALLAASAVYNLVVTSQSGAAWWNERKAARYMGRIGVGPNLVMSKTIYLADLEEAATGTAAAMTRPLGESECYSTFQAIVNTTDPDGPVADAGPALSTAASRATARRLRRARQRLGAHRHDLLVAMRVVNGVEAQLVQSEWENWLADEMARCDRIRALLEEVPSGPGAGGGGGSSAELQKRALLRAWREQYCGSCQADRLALLAAGRGAGPSLV